MSSPSQIIERTIATKLSGSTNVLLPSTWLWRNTPTTLLPQTGPKQPPSPLYITSINLNVLTPENKHNLFDKICLRHVAKAFNEYPPEQKMSKESYEEHALHASLGDVLFLISEINSTTQNVMFRAHALYSIVLSNDEECCWFVVGSCVDPEVQQYGIFTTSMVYAMQVICQDAKPNAKVFFAARTQNEKVANSVQRAGRSVFSNAVLLPLTKEVSPALKQRCQTIAQLCAERVQLNAKDLKAYEGGESQRYRKIYPPKWSSVFSSESSTTLVSSSTSPNKLIREVVNVGEGDAVVLVLTNDSISKL
eukprot:PhF_6_TR28089/c0_g1_i1/m.41510